MKSTESKGNPGMTTQPTSLPKCEKCDGTGMYMFKQKMSEYMRETKRENIYGDRPDFDVWVSMKCPYCNGGFASMVQEAKKNSDIPTTFYNKYLKDFEWDIYVDERGNSIDTSMQQLGVESFINQFDKWENKNMCPYIFSKTKGTGKTLLASCICNELMMKKAIKTRFVNESQLVDLKLGGDKNSNDEYKRNPMKLIYECKFLVIDDLGQKNTGREILEDILYNLLDYRKNNSRMTMITSNFAIQELTYKDKRIIDRINSLCMPFALPEFCVRSKETRENRNELLRELGITKKKEEKNENNTEGTDT